MVICGDANRGKDVDQFAGFAKAEGVETVIGLYDPQMSTISDVQRAVDFVAQHSFACATIHLVTDHWHLPRAGEMLQRTLSSSPVKEKSTIVRGVPVVGGEPITLEQEQREREGLLAFRRGTYQTGTKLGWGKPDDS